MTKRTAYLTIDDAPSAMMGQKLDYLLTKSIPAIWFCQGDLMDAHPELAVRAIREGFVVGNHSYDHPHFSDLSVDDCIRQIERTDAIVEALYREAGVQRPVRIFRFPYGDKGALNGSNAFAPLSAEGLARKQEIQACLARLGYIQPRWPNVTYRYFHEAGLQDDIDWYWTYDVLEYSIHAATPWYNIDSLEKVLARMDEDDPEGRRGLNSGSSDEIILTHDHLDTTPYFQSIIDRLLSKGLAFAMPEWDVGRRT